MIDVRLLREDPDSVIAALERRGIGREDIERVIELDKRWREVTTEVEGLRAEQNTRSKAIATASDEDRPRLIEAASELKQPLAVAEEEQAEVAVERDEILATLPNLPHPDAPDGFTEDEAVERRREGQRATFDFAPRDHVELMQPKDAVDLERAAKVSGARFFYLKGDGALLEWALVRYALDVAQRHDHLPVIPPVLVREDAMFGTGFLPTDEQQIFRTDERDDLYLVGTSEVALAGLHMDEILEAVPVRYVGFSTCFRREAGSYGKDTRGIFRVHQFDKVELFSFVGPEGSSDEHERILAVEEEIMHGLELHYRIVDIPVGDLGASAARKFDIEGWLPGQQAYRELTSCSNTTDYQARRLRTRYRTEDGGAELAHTLNGTAIAVPRTIIAVVEQHQREDGSVAVPETLQPYLGRDVLFAG
ncbi:MAG: serine--tRNA ligase [Actinobacteria bacterium]|nr:serine--tRNA ligase [Actinomycetota bacterium]